MNFLLSLITYFSLCLPCPNPLTQARHSNAVPLDWPAPSRPVCLTCMALQRANHSALLQQTGPEQGCSLRGQAGHCPDQLAGLPSASLSRTSVIWVIYDLFD